MQTRLQQWRQTLHSVLTGWLVVALLLTAPLALAPLAASAGEPSESWIVAICSHDASAGTKDHHPTPCDKCIGCFASAGGIPSLPPPDIYLPVFEWREHAATFARFESSARVQLFRHSAYARGPPMVASI